MSLCSHRFANWPPGTQTALARTLPMNMMNVSCSHSQCDLFFSKCCFLNVLLKSAAYTIIHFMHLLLGRSHTQSMICIWANEHVWNWMLLTVTWDGFILSMFRGYNDTFHGRYIHSKHVLRLLKVPLKEEYSPRLHKLYKCERVKFVTLNSATS